jgi:hypothetical protein
MRSSFRGKNSPKPFSLRVWEFMVQ